MAALSDNDVALIDGEFQSDLSSTRTPIALKKSEIRAALAAINVWLEANQAAFNSAIPQPARGVLTVKQKAELLLRVVRRKYEVT